jgi:8-oxo-dGTP pyrophosphatase MutT (NUDIX family)
MKSLGIKESSNQSRGGIYVVVQPLPKRQWQQMLRIGEKLKWLSSEDDGDLFRRATGQEIFISRQDAACVKRESSAAKKKADHIDENGYWAGAGGGASGILPICTTTGRICLAWRSSYVDEGDCWGTVGGAIQAGMSPAESAQEELKEEVGYHGSIRLIPAFVFTHGKFKYHNFLGLVPSEFSLNPMQGGSSNLQFTDETDAIAWFTWDDLQRDTQSSPGDYHSGVLKLLQQSGDQIHEICEICEAASNRSTGG